jgi:hypothetical protein
LTLTNVQLAQMGVYDVALTDDSGTVTTDTAELVVQIEPVVTLAPQSTIVTKGDTLRLTAAVTNTATLPLHFRWRRGTGYLTTNIVYAYEDTLELTNAGPAHGSNYTLTVANEARMGGTPLTPNTYVVVVDPPQNVQTDAGSAAQFAVTTYSRPHRFEYQWQFNGTDIQGATNRTLDIPSVAEANYGTYRLSITVYTNVGTTPIVMGPAYYTATLTKPGQGDLRIEVPAFTGTNVVLRFQAVANTTYSVLYQDVLNPTSSWTRLENVSGAGTNRTVQVLDRGPLPARRFYRLVTPAQ